MMAHKFQLNLQCVLYLFSGKMGQHDKKMERQLSAAACPALPH